MALLEYEPQQPLYHYCSPAGFEGILKSKVLWFHDLTQMNDPRELELGFEHFIGGLTSVRHDEYQGHRGFFLSILAGKLAGLRESHQAFCCCFSLADDELPLWGEYTGYSGLSIGFKPTAVKNIQARVQKADYLSDTTGKTYRAKVLDIAALYDPDGETHDERFWTNASVVAFAAITALKHNSWAYEREIRMIHLQAKEAPGTSSTLVSAVDDDYERTAPSKRIAERGEVSYLPFEFGRYRDGNDRHRRAIVKVTIGPKCPLTIDDVDNMLDANGYLGVDVVRSECRIR
ncbi:DUF2971 domain-containing protein [Rhizobium ruizarguesonis]|uniref:DUF2971 domain-containing protein n=1 Tax=Rhizobium ruizarguesonis TaxID=2081791 RepID=UPI00102F5B11|nr:DUF2971 domain-containing protein [Rhizobium ruizarguesonis]TAZ53217.1 DUF2971 domain-containing protein [Rhizobium ruizarguesonis]